MRKLLLFASSISIFLSCTKNESRTFNQLQDSSTLISITGDSADFSFSYEDGKVTDVLARHDDGGNYFGDSSYAPYAHLSYDGDSYIKATSTNQNSGYAYTEYFINENKLPEKIIIHFNNNSTDVVDFFYNAETNLLDSVHDSNDSIHFTTATIKYDDADINGVTITHAFLNNIIRDSIAYTYNKAKTNVFKTLDVLWYVYNIPFGTYNQQNSWVQINADLLAKLFSEHTFTQMRATFYSNSAWDTFQYTLNSASNLSKEWYTSFPQYITYYNYK